MSKSQIEFLNPIEEDILAEGIDFEFVEIPEKLAKESKNPSIRILNGDYENIVVQLGTMSVKEIGDDGTAIMDFNFRIIDSAGKSSADLMKNEHFKNTIGDIIRVCMNEALGTDNENRTDDTQGTNL